MDEGKEPGATHLPPVADHDVPKQFRVTVASLSPRGRRRAGRAFGPERVAIEVTAEVLEQLVGDPQLIVDRGEPREGADQ